ncbi:chitin synthase [Histoplasma capsulatum H143]|uniref:chitin synthase n=1 Tax=Ajellomyces capsulatus (strain H143) TaxID=544712 RepID=C6HLJ0_AJECH|nr:chitin synthase [Histoplasma capsulatum H143]
MDSRNLSRKKSLIRPERTRMNRNHPNYHYRQHAQNMATYPSTTGNEPVHENGEADTMSSGSTDIKSLTRRDGNNPGADYHEDGDRSRKLRGRHPSQRDVGKHAHRKLSRKESRAAKEAEKRRQEALDAIKPPSLWNVYCGMVTFWCPDFLLKCFGMPAKAQRRAWREKMGLISIILLICTFVGFLTFGFTQVVCGSPGVRLKINQVDVGYIIFHGKAYSMEGTHHPEALGIPDRSNVAYPPVSYGGMDASFLFQNVNGACKGLITAAPNSNVPTNSNGELAWYFPCVPFKQDGSSQPNFTEPPYLGYACHMTEKARNTFYHRLAAPGVVYFKWDDLKNKSRNLIVYSGNVLDLNLLDWFDRSQVTVPRQFDELKANPAIKGADVTHLFQSSADKRLAKCLTEIIKVGAIDTESVGCIASKVVLYVSLAFILSVVGAKFVLALTFQWFLASRFAAKTTINPSSTMRKKQIEDWSDDIYQPGPRLTDPALPDRGSRRGSKISSAIFPTTSRFTSPYAMDRGASKQRAPPTTMVSQNANLANPMYKTGQNTSQGTLSADPYRHSLVGSRTSLMLGAHDRPFSMSVSDVETPGMSGFVNESVVPQPPPEWQPFGYPLAHAICLVTAYSEGAEGLRTTLDSIAMTDYPNSHKTIVVICDGLIKERRNCHYPRHYSSLMRTLLSPETSASRKRDSQIILMSFLQKVMFDERMTELEFEMFNGLWKITGISPDFYEVALMVDADTKVFPDSLTHMVSAMVKDPEIMGLCGETKIANKKESWVTMIQVFEYFISHHLSKSFESVFGGVTCLPGCFCMYRIKAPKGGQNYWVPILANPDVVEHYSENVVDTLHKKNLLLLGEDRYLSTLMLKTFPKRKQVFVPQAVCKTTVPEKFSVLLSQRRRWINSTVHNLMELVLVRDLCGTFCFSMQFVVFMELVGTLVLPAAISFTFYVIVISIIRKPVQVIPLVLLALILGLPAILIVVTAHRLSYRWGDFERERRLKLMGTNWSQSQTNVSGYPPHQSIYEPYDY